MLAVAGGIILAFFILGLLEEMPDWFWYWVWGVIAVVIIWFLWPSFWSDVLSFMLIVSVVVIMHYGWIWLGKKIECRKSKHKKGNK